jgi:hypothetical protein
MFESQPVHLDTFLPKRGATLPVQFQVPLAQLPTGKYTCQINLIDENGHKFAFDRADIQIWPPAQTSPTAGTTPAPKTTGF